MKSMKQRQAELDLLRIIALLAVLCVHALGMFDGGEASDAERTGLAIVSCVITWEVPAFVMISGRFFLDPERAIPNKKLAQSIARIIIAFIVWNIFYQIYYISSGAYAGLNRNGILSEALQGPYHFWFLFMLVCLYGIVPFLRFIAQSKSRMEYFIFLFLLFELLNCYGGDLPGIGSTIAAIMEKTSFHFALGFSGYYILGYYLHRYRLSNRQEVILYALAAALVIGAAIATLQGLYPEGADAEYFVKYLNPNIAVVSSALYTCFVKRVSKISWSDKTIGRLARLSEYSFGVYLSHALILELISLTGVANVPVSPLIKLPLYVLCAFVIGNLLTGLIRRIPILGRKIT